nr:syntaxin-32 [Ipomoea batatas]
MCIHVDLLVGPTLLPSSSSFNSDPQIHTSLIFYSDSPRYTPPSFTCIRNWRFFESNPEGLGTGNLRKMMIKAASTSIRDRTNEFQNIAERLKKSSSSTQNGPSSAASSSSSASRSADDRRSMVALQSEFNKRASKVGFGIHQTSQKLAKLAKLAKRTSVFDDPTSEIQELTAVIKQDITALNSAVVDLQLHSNSGNESGNRDTTSHSTTVVDDLKNRLMSTTKEFKDVLTMRTEARTGSFFERQLFSSSTSKDSSSPFVRQRPLGSRSAASSSAAPPPPWANASKSSSQLFPRKQADSDTQPLLQQQQQQEQQQQQMVPLQDSYMQSRAEALQNVEATIHELGSIFNQLATLVSQQGEIAIRIDENMEDTLANVEGAQGALLKYLNSISSNRWLMIKIFFVLIFFLMIFLFFVA